MTSSSFSMFCMANSESVQLATLVRRSSSAKGRRASAITLPAVPSDSDGTSVGGGKMSIVGDGTVSSVEGRKVGLVWGGCIGSWKLEVVVNVIRGFGLAGTGLVTWSLCPRLTPGIATSEVGELSAVMAAS